VARLSASLEEQLEGSRYILGHLGAHLVIGATFAFDLVPLPLGVITRVAWVGGNRVVESLRGRFERARVHSLGVLLIAAIPWIGYAAYLLPLRKRSSELAFMLANHTWLARTGRSYEDYLATMHSPVRRLGRWLVPLPDASTIPEASSARPRTSPLRERDPECAPSCKEEQTGRPRAR